MLGSDRLGTVQHRVAVGLRTTQMEDRYVDTADGRAGPGRFRGPAAPDRRLDPRLGQVAAAHRWPGRLRSPRGARGPGRRVAPPSDWPASDARALVLEHAGDAPLVERVTIRQLRRKRQLRSATTRVELSLDEVDVVARDRIVDRFIELEAELTRGDETELTALGAALADEPTLVPARTSKLEAGLAALDGIATSDGAAEVADPTAAGAPGCERADQSRGSSSDRRPG